MSRKVSTLPNPVMSPESITKAKNSVLFQEKQDWYFWDETWSHSYGPYKTLLEAENALYDYCKKLG
jgi:hypothetical protein